VECAYQINSDGQRVTKTVSLFTFKQDDAVSVVGALRAAAQKTPCRLPSVYLSSSAVAAAAAA
jgi:hypothetical protein